MLIIQPIGGLCNRMRAIGSGIELAKKRGDKLLVIWLIHPELGAAYDEIFKPNADYDVINIRSNFHPLRVAYFLGAKLFGSLVKNEDIRGNRDENGLYESYLETLKPFTYIATEEHFLPYTDYASFVPTETVMAKIEGKKKELGDHAVGVHIRRTDNRPAIGKSSTEAFIRCMKAELDAQPDTMFYLATDDMTEEAHLREVFPGKILSNETRDLSRDSVAGIQDAMVDLYCLAATKKIIGSYFSSFTDIAAMMHDIPKIVAE